MPILRKLNGKPAKFFAFSPKNRLTRPLEFSSVPFWVVRFLPVIDFLLYHQHLCRTAKGVSA